MKLSVLCHNLHASYRFVCLIAFVTYILACKNCGEVDSHYLVYYMSFIVRKPVFGVSDMVQHKSGCTATEDG